MPSAELRARSTSRMRRALSQCQQPPPPPVRKKCKGCHTDKCKAAYSRRQWMVNNLRKCKVCRGTGTSATATPAAKRGGRHASSGRKASLLPTCLERGVAVDLRCPTCVRAEKSGNAGAAKKDLGKCKGPRAQPAANRSAPAFGVRPALVGPRPRSTCTPHNTGGCRKPAAVRRVPSSKRGGKGRRGGAKKNTDTGSSVAQDVSAASGARARADRGESRGGRGPGYDCGVMICMYMLHLAKKLPMHYTGADARVFRQRLVLSIMRGKLMF